MTRLTPRQAASWWVDEGGPANRVVAWVAVGVAESSLDDHAVSPAGALGIYQIMPFNFAPLGLPESLWYVAGINTRAAVLLSGGGMNFAPWDTAYANINRSGRYRFLAWPEGGSAAWNNMPYVAATIGATATLALSPPAQPGVTGTLPAALDWYARITHQGIPAQIGYTRRLAAAIHGLYRR